MTDVIERVRPILDRPFFYEFYNSLIGANHRSRVLVSEYIRPKPHDRILDIGCGPGNMLPFLPDCHYLGVDANPTCIAFARQRYSNRGEFICERVNRHAVKEFAAFDIVLALGLVHHLDAEEARGLFRLAYMALRPGGRMITNDGCYVPGQSQTKRFLLSRDRGRYVRTEDQYLELAREYFDEVKPHIREDVLRIPYTHLILECIRGTSDE